MHNRSPLIELTDEETIPCKNILILSSFWRRDILRILIVNHYAGSLSHGMEYRPYYFAQEWIRRGHEIDIIAADFSHLRKENPHVTHNFQQEDID